jgi:hypothetical protein
VKTEKLKQFFEQLRGKGNPTAQDIRNAAAAAGDVSEIIPVILSYTAGMGIDTAAELADLTKAQEAVRKTAEEEEKGRIPHFERVITAEIKPVSWIVKKTIERGTVVLVFGDSEIGKSFFAISLAASIATKTDFTDFFGCPVKKAGSRSVCRRRGNLRLVTAGLCMGNHSQYTPGWHACFPLYRRGELD